MYLIFRNTFLYCVKNVMELQKTYTLFCMLLYLYLYLYLYHKQFTILYVHWITCVRVHSPIQISIINILIIYCEKIFSGYPLCFSEVKSAGTWSKLLSTTEQLSVTKQCSTTRTRTAWIKSKIHNFSRTEQPIALPFIFHISVTSSCVHRDTEEIPDTSVPG